MKEKILIAIPAYNCEKQITRLLRELFQVSELWRNYEVEVLLIDNGSTDQTVQAARSIFESEPLRKLTLIRNRNNIGLGGTQKAAFLWAARNRFSLLVVLHGDHQATPRELPRLLEVANNPRYAAVLGSRFSSGSVRTGYSMTRVFGNIVLNLLYSILSLRFVADLGSGLNVFRLDHFDLHRVTGYSNGFTFNMDLLLDMISRRRVFHYRPITWTELDQVSNARNFRVGWAAVKSLLVWRVRCQQRQENVLGFDHEILLEHRP